MRDKLWKRIRRYALEAKGADECYPEDTQACIACIIADLRTVCDIDDLDFAAIDRNAYQVYLTSADRAEANTGRKAGVTA